MADSDICARPKCLSPRHYNIHDPERGGHVFVEPSLGGEGAGPPNSVAAPTQVAPAPDEPCDIDDLPDCLVGGVHQSHCRHKGKPVTIQTSAVVAPATPPAQATPKEGGRGPEGATLTERARKLFRPPFRFEMGYVWDSAGEMVADNREDQEDAAALPALRVRGWGRIGYLPEPEALHDEAGRLIAEALTKGWPSTGRSNG